MNFKYVRVDLECCNCTRLLFFITGPFLFSECRSSGKGSSASVVIKKFIHYRSYTSRAQQCCAKEKDTVLVHNLFSLEFNSLGEKEKGGGQGPIKIESLSLPCQQVPKMNWPSRLLYHRKTHFLCTSLCLCVKSLNRTFHYVYVWVCTEALNNHRESQSFDICCQHPTQWIQW